MTAQEKTLERLAGHIEGETTETSTKETIDMHQSTSTISTDAMPPLSLKAEAFIRANHNAQILPVDAIIANFARPERSHVGDRMKPVVAANGVARLASQTHVVPSYYSSDWEGAEFHVIATAGSPRNASHACPTDPKRRELRGYSIKPSDHPVHTAKVGDTWAHTLEDGDHFEYEYLGRFYLVGQFVDADTNVDQYVIREVSN